MKLKKLASKIFTVIAVLISVMHVGAQSTQTLRGKIVDEVSKAPLIGVFIILTTDDKILGNATDTEGNYRIENVPVGRQTLHVTYLGYEEQIIPNVVVTAGKEVIVNLSLTESVSQLNEVVIKADTRDDKTATNNDLALVSARSFNVDDTKRYAGALGDPSRMAANFAGVIGGDDSRNDIVVRGNSPTGMLWQLEGLNIPNPNHFGALNSTGGPVSMLNNNNLDKSDFITSAFPSQYGNATAGVFDIRLRDGNNEQHEFLGQIGFNGFELGAEGPFSQKGKASYIINYRYSTLGIFDAMGIDFGTGGNVPLYQDLNFKISLPTKNGAKWSIFGLGGTSEIDLLGSEADIESDDDLYGDVNEDSFPRYKTGIFGASYEQNITEKTFARLTLGLSAAEESFTSDSLVRDSNNEVVGRFLRSEAAFQTRKFSATTLLRTKFNSQNSLTYGFFIDVMKFDLFNRDVYANVGTDSIRIDIEDNTTLYQLFTTWKHRFNSKFFFTAGVHGQYYSLNEQAVVEPRLGFQYVINGDQSLSIGYGLHNQMQNQYTSYVQTKTASGDYILTNLGLDFTTSHHTVLTYDWNINDNLRLRAETYYQQLSHAPVEQTPSSFSALNVGSSFDTSDQDSLVSEGTGTNYGFELTLERFFSKGYYFLFTTSIFNSRYEGSDGVERNTAFNTHYVFNGLAGKEWRLGKNSNFLSLNMKLTTIGGKYLTPVDEPSSRESGEAVYDESRAYSERQDPYFRIDLKFSYRKEYKRSTLEVSLDLQNVTDHENVFDQGYNTRTNTVVTQYQQGFFPVPFVRYTF